MYVDVNLNEPDSGIKRDAPTEIFYGERCNVLPALGQCSNEVLDSESTIKDLSKVTRNCEVETGHQRDCDSDRVHGTGDHDDSQSNEVCVGESTIKDMDEGTGNNNVEPLKMQTIH